MKVYTNLQKFINDYYSDKSEEWRLIQDFSSLKGILKRNGNLIDFSENGYRSWCSFHPECGNNCIETRDGCKKAIELDKIHKREIKLKRLIDDNND